MEAVKIKIFDTTLRDGQQCPGAGMSFQKNIEYARLAAEVGVDVLEAGFPSASQTEFMIVNTIAKEVAPLPSSPIIAGLCQLREAQVETTILALQPAHQHKKARLHTYLPVDPELMRVSLGEHAKQLSVLIEDVYRLIKIASASGLEVEFSPEGYSRMGTHFDFVTDLIRAAVSAGATIINCPDTIGGACRLQGKDYFVEHMKRHAEIIKAEFPDKEITWSAHCHNDFGLALDNTMNAVFFGPATQIEGCFNGLGERAGNVALEQCAMYIKAFGEQGIGNKTFTTGLNTKKLQAISDFVSLNMLTRQANWPITGENAAKHTSGGHTNAIMKNPLAYQPFHPADTGKEISFVFGPSSGGNHAKTIIENFGYSCAENEKSVIAQFIKDYYSDRRKGVTDSELLYAYFEYRKPIKAEKLEYAKNDNTSYIKITGQFFTHQGTFDYQWKGSDSALATLHHAISEYMPGIVIESYHSQSDKPGVDAISQSKIIIRDTTNQLFTGTGEDQDIEISALKALIDAANLAYLENHYRKKP